MEAVESLPSRELLGITQAKSLEEVMERVKEAIQTSLEAEEREKASRHRNCRVQFIEVQDIIKDTDLSR